MIETILVGLIVFLVIGLLLEYNPAVNAFSYVIGYRIFNNNYFVIDGQKCFLLNDLFEFKGLKKVYECNNVNDLQPGEVTTREKLIVVRSTKLWRILLCKFVCWEIKVESVIDFTSLKTAFPDMPRLHVMDEALTKAGVTVRQFVERVAATKAPCRRMKDDSDREPEQVVANYMRLLEWSTIAHWIDQYVSGNQ